MATVGLVNGLIPTYLIPCLVSHPSYVLAIVLYTDMAYSVMSVMGGTKSTYEIRV